MKKYEEMKTNLNLRKNQDMYAFQEKNKDKEKKAISVDFTESPTTFVCPRGNIISYIFLK